MEIKLIVVSGEGLTGPFDVKLPATVGRHREAAVVLASRMISRKHCDLFEKDGVLMVRDLGSLNGTYIGVNRVSGEAAVKPGGLLTIGPFTFRAEYAGPSGALDDSGTVEMPDFELQDTSASPAKGTAQTIEFEDLPGEPASAAPASSAPASAAQPAANGDDDGFSMDWLMDEEEEPVAPKAKAAAKPAPKPSSAVPTANNDEIDFELNDSANGPTDDPLADLAPDSGANAAKPKDAPKKKAPADPSNETTDFILPDPSDTEQPSLSGFLKDL